MEGAYWHNLTSNTVQVTRYPDDQQVKQVRVVLVHGTQPDYDSLVERGSWQSNVIRDSIFTTREDSLDNFWLFLHSDQFITSVGQTTVDESSDQ